MNPLPNQILKNIKTSFSRYYYQYSVTALFVVVLLLVNALPYSAFARMSYLSKAMVVFLLVILMFKIQSKIMFFVSLFSLVIALFFLINGNQSVSEAWATAVYGFFALGIFASLFDNRKDFN